MGLVPGSQRTGTGFPVPGLNTGYPNPGNAGSTQLVLNKVIRTIRILIVYKRTYGTPFNGKTVKTGNFQMTVIRF